MIFLIATGECALLILGRQICVLFFISCDGTTEDGIDRYINDDTKPNCKMVVLCVDDVPSLCLFALGDGIQKGMEPHV